MSKTKSDNGGNLRGFRESAAAESFNYLNPPSSNNPDYVNFDADSDYALRSDRENEATDIDAEYEALLKSGAEESEDRAGDEVFKIFPRPENFMFDESGSDNFAKTIEDFERNLAENNSTVTDQSFKKKFQISETTSRSLSISSLGILALGLAGAVMQTTAGELGVGGIGRSVMRRGPYRVADFVGMANLATNIWHANNVYATHETIDIAATLSPTSQPTYQPSAPSGQPTGQPTGQPSKQPTAQPTRQPTGQPTMRPTIYYDDDIGIRPTSQPTRQPTGQPTRQPTGQPTRQPTRQPTGQPTRQPTGQPTRQPSGQPTRQPSEQPTGQPTRQPTNQPTGQPSYQPTHLPTVGDLIMPSYQPTSWPSGQPTNQPSAEPTSQPSNQPSNDPTSQPSVEPTSQPSISPTSSPTNATQVEPEAGLASPEESFWSVAVFSVTAAAAVIANALIYNSRSNYSESIEGVVDIIMTSGSDVEIASLIKKIERVNKGQTSESIEISAEGELEKINRIFRVPNCLAIKSRAEDFQKGLSNLRNPVRGVIMDNLSSLFQNDRVKSNDDFLRKNLLLVLDGRDPISRENPVGRVAGSRSGKVASAPSYNAL